MIHLFQKMELHALISSNAESSLEIISPLSALQILLTESQSTIFFYHSSPLSHGGLYEIFFLVKIAEAFLAGTKVCSRDLNFVKSKVRMEFSYSAFTE